jgi:Domain of Unknown Function (DUF1206)
VAEIEESARDLGRRAEDSDLVDHAIRLGLVAYGLVYLVICVLAVRLALGDRAGEVSSTGALSELAQQPFGRVLLLVIAVGLFVLVLWRGVEAVAGHRDVEGGARVAQRAGSGLKAVVYGALALSALRVALGAGTQKGTSKTLTAQVLGWPGGAWIVAAAGLAMLGYGLFYAWRGLTDQHADKLAAEGTSGDAGRAYLMLGRVGYVAKGVSVGLVGALVVWAGLAHRPKATGGLDQALQKLLHQPLGPVAVTVIGLGIGCYGLFCLARARHLSR